MKINYFKALIMIAFFVCLQMNGQILTPIPSNQGTPFNSKFCGTETIHQEMMENDPEYKTRHLQTLEVIRTAASSQTRLPNEILQVPVVVHVMHKGEALGTGTNISDEDVRLGVKYLNNFWRKMAGSNGDGMGVDMKIEFILAIQDENGNTTNGIIRVDMSSVTEYVDSGVKLDGGSGLPEYDDAGGINSLKEYSKWDQTKYYNVWLVDEIDNANCYSGGSYTAGFAYYSSLHGRPKDGSVVLICTYLSDSSSTWAHEMGHALNLKHTFDSDSTASDCGNDGVHDTPSHINVQSEGYDCESEVSNVCDPSFSQVINPETGFRRDLGTVQDHMFNYMDYSACTSEFTGGQRTRSEQALTMLRTSFIADNNTKLVPASKAVVDFTSQTIACLDGVVLFTDLSSNTPNSYTNTGYDNISFAWTFDNGVGSRVTSTDQNPSITFTDGGTYDVTLEITNPQGTSSLTKPNSLFVSSTSFQVMCDFQSSNTGNFGTGVTSVSFNTLNNNTSTSNVAPFVRDFRCAKNTQINLNSSYDLTVVYSARDEHPQRTTVWIDWDNSGSFEVTERVLENNVVAGNAGTHTATETITPPLNAVKDTPLTMRVVSDTFSTGNTCSGSSLKRADDYGILVSDALSTTELTALQLKIYPNPVQDVLTITLENKASLSAYAIYDISGKQVMTSILNPTNRIQVSGLSKGLYFIKVKAANSEMVGKFIKK